mmetsp:Transcript_17895/g.56134  ORF Transcript_17895/g.56134 Transcript_17895/m.56134 type:complete len:91 (+) Transcript_17895:1712-1984(+)
MPTLARAVRASADDLVALSRETVLCTVRVLEPRPYRQVPQSTRSSCCNGHEEVSRRLPSTSLADVETPKSPIPPLRTHRWPIFYRDSGRL